MEITSETYDNIIKLKDVDDIFEKTIGLLSLFKDKYKDISQLNDEKIFKTEVKVIFQLLYHVFTNEELDELDDEEVQKFKDLIFNIRNVIDSIDNYDLKQPDEITTSSLNYVLEYFAETNKDMEELNTKMDNTSERIGELAQLLEQKQRQDEICKVLKEDITDETREYLQSSSKWCKLRLKDFDKNLVIKVIENKHSNDPINYCNEITNLLEKSEEETNELNKLINIDITMTILISIENKLKK